MEFQSYLNKQTEKEKGVKFQDWALHKKPHGIIQHITRLAEDFGQMMKTDYIHMEKYVTESHANELVRHASKFDVQVYTPGHGYVTVKGLKSDIEKLDNYCKNKRT
jgi:hypothetical protein